MSDSHHLSPQGLTKLEPGAYKLVCTGPKGIVFNLTVDLAHRTSFECLLDDERLQELLVVTSVASGVIEGELHLAQKQQASSLLHDGEGWAS